ncbi:MAG: acriflavine resistance protein B [Gammaproteobacteria bacterium]|nr:MAG: acriflavine resistance protein B [Gammaproteobacteria bacterium]
MNITRLAISNNRTSFIILFFIVLAGVSAYQQMPKDYDPGFIIRTAQVITHFPGASPSRVESLVSDKLEKVIKELPELDFVKSESRTGISIISVNIKESYKNMRPIWDKLRRKVQSAQDDLPSEAQTPIVNDEFGDVYGIVLGLTAEGFSYKELKDISDSVKDEFLRLSEVGKVDIFGVQEERVFIEYNNARLSELQLSPSQLSSQLADRNIVIPGGSINLSNQRISLEPTGNFESIEDIEKTIVQIPGSDHVLYLQEIAKISRGYIDPFESKLSISGTEGLVIAISMREGGNNLVLGKQVKKIVARLSGIYPIGVEFDYISFMPKEVEEKVNDFVSNLIQAIVIVTLVMLFSLGMRTGIIVAVLIPLSMVFGILIMSWVEIGIDQISLAALIISLGMLVDNGIVMSESIMVQMTQGKRSIDAAIDSANELKIPLLVSSLTTSAAFLPIFLAESATGEYTASLFKVVTITLLCSWILSMTMIPLLCVYFLKSKQPKQNFETPFFQKYRRILAWLIKKRWQTLMATLVVFVISMAGLQLVPKLFFPPSDRTYFKVELELPIGSTIESTKEMVGKIEAYFQEHLVQNKKDEQYEQDEQGITNWVTYIGSGGPKFLLTHNPKPKSPNYALMVVNVTSLIIIDETMKQIDNFTFNNFPDLLVKLKKIENGKPIPNPIEVRLSGSDTDELFEIKKKIVEKMNSIQGLKSISDNWGLPIKKLLIEINQTRARRAGVSSKDIAISLRTGLTGLELTQYRDGDTVIPIIMRTVEKDRKDISKLESLSVYSQASGASVPLKQVADIKVVWEPALVIRRDRVKTITIGSQLAPGTSANEIFEALDIWLIKEQQNWPIGYFYEFGGEAESSQKANQSIADKLPIAVFIIILLLVGQFNSIRKSIIVLATIPLGMIGVVFGLLVGQSFFGFMTLLGIISLAGIVINNAIVLLERIKIELEDNNQTPIEAIIQACQKRLRPIVLTTATTIMGLVPLYLGGGEMWEPMALAIMGGLLFSTIFTLGVIPVFYTILFRIK